MQEMGWSGITNGELLRRDEASFDVLITSDQNLPRQQDFSLRRLALIVLPSNRVPVLGGLIEQVQRQLSAIRAGEVVRIPLPP